MQIKTQGAGGQQKMPNTQVVSLLSDQLFILLRSWNGTEVNQKIVEEINRYMSSVEADLEVTSPFGYSESLSRYANEVRVSLQMANHAIYHGENKDFYQHGAEIAVVYKKDHEIAWASLGRYSIEALKEGRRIKIFDSGTQFDDDILLPTGLIGLYKDPEIYAGSISTKKLDSIEIKSVFGQFDSVWECIVSDF